MLHSTQGQMQAIHGMLMDMHHAGYEIMQDGSRRIYSNRVGGFSCVPSFLTSRLRFGGRGVLDIQPNRAIVGCGEEPPDNEFSDGMST